MHQTNDAAFRGIDLNLLVALRALLTERHVTRAAARVGISQPAMSHALARLRMTLNDPLLVRARDGLQLTPRGAALVEPLDRVLGGVNAIFSKPEEFDPKTSTRRFRISGSDYAEIVLLPALLERIAREAPHVDIALLRHDGHAVDALEDGSTDVLMIPPGVVSREGRAIFSRRLLKERFVCVVRKDHPRVGRKMTLERFLELPHLMVSLRGVPGGIVDDALAKRGLRRRVAVLVPHFLVAPFLVERTDLVLTLAERIARTLAPAVNVRSLTPPPELALDGFDIHLVWHERDNADPGHVWFRSLITSVARTSAK